MPASSPDRIASIASASSVPPHIQPPMAQVPRPTAEAWMPERPISRVIIPDFIITSCDIANRLQGFKDAGGSFLVNDQRVDKPAAQRGADRHDLRGTGGDADDVAALRDFLRRQGHQPLIEGVIRDRAVRADKMG